MKPVTVILCSNPWGVLESCDKGQVVNPQIVKTSLDIITEQINDGETDTLLFNTSMCTGWRIKVNREIVFVSLRSFDDNIIEQAKNRVIQET